MFKLSLNRQVRMGRPLRDGAWPRRDLTASLPRGNASKSG